LSATARGGRLLARNSRQEIGMIVGIKFVSIPTRDQDRALKFYTEKLGFRLITDQPFSPTQRWIELGIGNADTRFVLFTPDGAEARIGSRFDGALACDDVEATHRQLTAKGVEFEQPPTKQPWGTFAIMRDPDGNKFVLSSR
jgi:catechol 2,3-dioxygenase-like lactoylglutathione lyase family enzyme